MPYSPFRGTLVLDDPLHNNSKGYNWQEGKDSAGSCGFIGGAYHVITPVGEYYYPCIAHDADFGNFAYEMQVKILKGDCGALLFRMDATLANFYYFRICQDGSSALFLYQTNTNGSTLIPSHSNSGMNTGLNQSNLLAVVAQGNTLDLYINQQKVDSISDSAFSHGKIGVVADGFPNKHPTEVAYSNLKVWTF
jgi:hypothetical protein